MTTNPPQHANFSQIFYPDGTCGVVDGLRDCMQPGVVLGSDPLEPEPKTATWFCERHWAEFEMIYSVAEDKRRYRVNGFSPGLVGVWDTQAKDFVKNPDSGRRKLFHRRENAKKLADKLNKEEDKRTKETTP